MSFAFDRPIGAAADVTELDYVAALHQTDVRGGLRKDGSIQDVDISLFLSSRYGVIESPEQVRKKILSGLGSNDGYMDMMQLVSLLLIPILRQEQEHRQQQNTVKEDKDDDLLEYTLQMMLHDVTGSRAPKPLTRTLVKQILQAYGETKLSENEELVRQMLQQAGALSNRRVLLDTDTFCRALTSDVQEYNVENKNKLTTNFEDVMLLNSDMPSSSAELEQAAAHKFNRQRKESLTPTVFNKNTTVDDIPLVFMAPQVDNAADTYRSKPLIVFQWTFFVLSFQTYLLKYLRGDFMGLRYSCAEYQYSEYKENIGAFFCSVGLSILRWIVVMLVMSVAGLLYFFIAGIGNFTECKNPLFPMIGLMFSLVCMLLPWWFIGRNTKPNEEDGSYQAFLGYAQEFLEYATFVLGGCTILLSIWQMLSLVVPRNYRILVPEAIVTESRIKQSFIHKFETMVSNALEVHRVKKQESVVPTHFGQALLNFAEKSPEIEEIGGFCWTWHMICSKDLFRREGLFFSGRLLSTNFTQFALTPFIMIGGVMITSLVSSQFDEKVAYVEELLEKYHVSVDIDYMTLSTQFAITAALATGTSVAFVTALAISLMVLPSATTTALKFRSGVIPFVADTQVKSLRIAPDQTAYLKGLMFWGTLYASIIMGCVIAFLVFAFSWEVTASLAQQVLAIVVGALFVLGIHILFVKICRRVTSQAFYRKKPATANVTLLIRECGLIALTQGFVIVRILKLLLTTVFYCGRVDSPLLHVSCGQVGGNRVDREPYMFQIDILQHEAHRHPYIETLGVMYLSKLRHGDMFCTFAGSCWRLIFVYVLMPWLSKYRAMRRPHVEFEGEDEAEPPSPPLRAVTLVDPQAYALRAVSLVPVASNWAGGSSLSILGPRARSKDLSLIGDDDGDAKEEIRELQEEVRQLRMQLRLQEANVPPAVFRAPHRSPRFDPSQPKPGWEADYADIVIHSPQPQDLNQDDMVTRHYTPPTSPSVLGRIPETRPSRWGDTDESPRPPRRKKSEGLPTLRPPTGGHQVSWADRDGQAEM